MVNIYLYWLNHQCGNVLILITSHGNNIVTYNYQIDLISCDNEGNVHDTMLSLSIF